MARNGAAADGGVNRVRLCLRHSARIGGAGLPYQWCLFIKNERSCVLDALAHIFFVG
jgi:hypothetical protein